MAVTAYRGRQTLYAKATRGGGGGGGGANAPPALPPKCGPVYEYLLELRQYSERRYIHYVIMKNPWDKIFANGINWRN